MNKKLGFKEYIPKDYFYLRNMADRISSDPKYAKQFYYSQLVQKVLTQFQLLETALKLYLEAAFLVIQLTMRGKVTFRYTQHDIENMSLGKLLGLFEKYNDNSSLHRQIRSYLKERNHYAHRGFLLFYGKKCDGLKQSEKLKRDTTKCEKLCSEISDLIEGVMKETHRLPRIR